MTCVGSAVLDVSSLLSSSDQSKVRTVLHAGGGPMRQEDLDILMDTPPATAASDMKKVRLRILTDQSSRRVIFPYQSRQQLERQTMF